MPGILRAQERCQRAAVRRNLGDEIIKVVGLAQHAQAACAPIPDFVEIEQAGDELGLRIGMDAAILLLRLAAHGDHQRFVGKLDAILLRHDVLEFPASDVLDQPGKRRPVGKLRKREDAGLADIGKVRPDRRQVGGVQHIGRGEEPERLTRDFRSGDRLKVDHDVPLNEPGGAGAGAPQTISLAGRRTLGIDPSQSRRPRRRLFPASDGRALRPLTWVNARPRGSWPGRHARGAV